ncbi:hypothetical protein HF325_001186 [Metschnikowia pulcherrima]|uniref:Xylose isomerase-like TIM barrel domain-containing protein n=1 Tax=Metschnikowia pulcherrima TaxID=27326 RepID=A0A8H7GUM7_9ASCO|nr:hypothetical protein HF325_001186 [Metschnikowia pulcherrima]
MTTLPTPKASKPPSPISGSRIYQKTFPARDHGTYGYAHASQWKDLPYENSIATVCFEGTIWEKIDATSKAGFDAIEIMTPDLEEATPEQIVEYCETRNLSISILQPFRDLEGYTNQGTFEERLRQFEDYLVTCRKLKSNLVLLCANCDKNSVSDLEVVVPQLRQAANLAAKYGIRIAYENLSWAAHYSHLENLVSVIELVDRDNFGICVDLFHINIHDIDILEHARNYRVFPFQGLYKNNLESLELLERLHYDGPLSLEVFNLLYRERSGQCLCVAEDALRSLVFLQGRYCDLHRGTSYLPALKITGIEFPKYFESWSQARISFDSEGDIDIFHERTSFTGYFEIKAATTLLGEKLANIGYIRVSSRLEFTRTILALRAALGFEPCENHKLNISNGFNLPLQSVFRNELEVSVVLTLLEEFPNNAHDERL